MAFDKPLVPKSAKKTKQEYAESPFTLNSLLGSQFTIEERLGISELPRVKSVAKRDGKGTYQTIALKVSDGIFEKDLHLFESDWNILCTVLPESLVNLQGVMLRATKDSNLRLRFEYIGVARQDMSGSSYQNGNHPAEQDAPTEIGNQIKSLHAAMQTNQATKITNTVKVVMDIAEKIRPGDALNLISEAKKQGYISERTEAGVTVYRAE